MLDRVKSIQHGNVQSELADVVVKESRARSCPILSVCHWGVRVPFWRLSTQEQRSPKFSLYFHTTLGEEHACYLRAMGIRFDLPPSLDLPSPPRANPHFLGTSRRSIRLLTNSRRSQNEKQWASRGRETAARKPHKKKSQAHTTNGMQARGWWKPG